MKQVCCDSSSIITLSTNCLLWLLDKFDCEFMIPNFVKKEVVDNPLNSTKYSFEAMRNGLCIGSSLKVEQTNPELRDQIIKLSNSLFTCRGRPIEIIQYGEADALALAIEKKVNMLLVDEKNTRLLIEDKRILKKVMERRTGKDLEINSEASKKLDELLKGIKVIRSSELVAVAINRGLLDWPYPKKELVRSSLTSLKYSGCAISSSEIIEITNIVAPTKI
jgi:predicted nucleic acid-binding protein